MKKPSNKIQAQHIITDVMNSLGYMSLDLFDLKKWKLSKDAQELKYQLDLAWKLLK